MRKHLYVDNVDLATYGVYISGGGTFSAPEKEYTWYSVPSRNGDILGLNRRLLNIKVTYDCFIYTNFDTNIANLRNFLLSRDGFVRISDDYHTGEFRKGVYEGPFEPTITKKLDAGSFQLTFNCMPQRYLTSGETATTYTSFPVNVTNPTQFPAQPLFRIYGTGELAVGNVSIFISSSYPYSYVDVDCENMSAYYGSTNVPQYVGFLRTGATLYGLDAPTLPSGVTAIRNLGSITKLELTPRWWEV